MNFSAKDIGFHEHNNQAYCEHCYTNIVLPKCRACEKPITDRTMKAMGNQWHVSCFVCKVSHVCQKWHFVMTEQCQDKVCNIRVCLCQSVREGYVISYLYYDIGWHFIACQHDKMLQLCHVGDLHGRKCHLQ